MSVFSRNFIKGAYRIRVEGIKLNKFLTECLHNGIEISRIKNNNEYTLECTISEKSYNKIIKKKYSNRYRITKLKSTGLPKYKREAMQKKGFAAGLLIFIYLLYYQSLFITEIEINGIETINENEFRTSLVEFGVVEGNKKIDNLEALEKYFYLRFDELSWIGIKYTGNKMVIDIAEKAKAPDIISYNIPCDIVARKTGYIEKVIAKYGMPIVQAGQFVREGDILISGMVKDEETEEIKYVHSLGEIYAKIIYRFNITEEKREIIKDETGKKSYGLRLKAGALDTEIGHKNVDYPKFKRQDSSVFDTMIPFPIKISLIEYSELDISYLQKEQKEIENSIAEKVSTYIKKNIPEDAEILNKDLMYEEERNIIKIRVIIESLEEIGLEAKMVPIF